MYSRNDRINCLQMFATLPTIQEIQVGATSKQSTSDIIYFDVSNTWYHSHRDKHHLVLFTSKYASLGNVLDELLRLFTWKQTTSDVVYIETINF